MIVNLFQVNISVSHMVFTIGHYDGTPYYFTQKIFNSFI